MSLFLQCPNVNECLDGSYLRGILKCKPVMTVWVNKQVIKSKCSWLSPWKRHTDVETAYKVKKSQVVWIRPFNDLIKHIAFLSVNLFTCSCTHPHIPTDTLIKDGGGILWGSDSVIVQTHAHSPPALHLLSRFSPSFHPSLLHSIRLSIPLCPSLRIPSYPHRIGSIPALSVESFVHLGAAITTHWYNIR